MLGNGINVFWPGKIVEIVGWLLDSVASDTVDHQVLLLLQFFCFGQSVSGFNLDLLLESILGNNDGLVVLGIPFSIDGNIIMDVDDHIEKVSRFRKMRGVECIAGKRLHDNPMSFQIVLGLILSL